MRSSSLGMLFELPELTASSPPESQVSFLSPHPEDRFRSGVVKNRYHPCWYCKRQTHPTMEEHEMCCKYDSYGEVSRLMIKAYTLALLLMATVMLWTAGDACLYFGFSYLDNRYGGGNSYHQGSYAGLGCWTSSFRHV
jgi:hypothetical protein